MIILFFEEFMNEQCIYILYPTKMHALFFNCYMYIHVCIHTYAHTCIQYTYVCTHIYTAY